MRGYGDVFDASKWPRMLESASRRSRREAGALFEAGARREGPVARIMRRMAVGRDGVRPVSGSGLALAQASMTSMSGG